MTHPTARRRLRNWTVGLCMLALVGCTSAPSIPRTPLPDSRVAATPGEASIVLHETGIWVLRMAQDIRRARLNVPGSNPAIPFLQYSVDQLEVVSQLLSPLSRTTFALPATPIPGSSGLPVYTATVDASGTRLFETAIVQDRGDRVGVTLLFDGFVGDPVLVQDNFKAAEGVLSKNGLVGIFRRFTNVDGKSGASDVEWAWSYNADGTSTMRINDGGPTPPNGLYPRGIELRFNPDFSGTGVVTTIDVTQSPPPQTSLTNLSWP